MIATLHFTAFLVFMSFGTAVFAQDVMTVPEYFEYRDFDFDSIEIRTETITPGLYVLSGRGGNVVASIGEQGVLIVDDHDLSIRGQPTVDLDRIGVLLPGQCDRGKCIFRGVVRRPAMRDDALGPRRRTQHQQEDDRKQNAELDWAVHGRIIAQRTLVADLTKQKPRQPKASGGCVVLVA